MRNRRSRKVDPDWARPAPMLTVASGRRTTGSPTDVRTPATFTLNPTLCATPAANRTFRIAITV